MSTSQQNDLGGWNPPRMGCDILCLLRPPILHLLCSFVFAKRILLLLACTGGNHRCGESRLENRRLVHVIVDIIFWFEICRSSIYFPSNYLLRIVLFSSTSRRAVYGTCNFVLFVDSQLERVTLPINLSRHGRLHMSVVHECHHLCLVFSVAQGKRQSNSTHFEYLIHVAQELIFSGTIDHRCCNCQFTKEFISFI